MDISASAISLNVADPDASAAFLSDYFGFSTDMSGDGYRSLSRPDAGFNLIYLRTGLSTFKPDAQKGPAGGLLIVFVVSDIDAEHQRLVDGGMDITTSLQTEPWGERFFQVTDPNGIVIQLVQWVAQPDEPGHGG
jgi:predicted enzyme related to lactoylglutathione lyase